MKVLLKIENVEIQVEFDVSEQTIYNWKVKEVNGLTEPGLLCYFYNIVSKSFKFALYAACLKKSGVVDEDFILKNFLKKEGLTR